MLSRVSIFLLWFAATIDPIGNFLYLRYIALATGTVALCALLLTKRTTIETHSTRTYTTIIVALIMPLHGFIIYATRGGSENFIDTSYIAAGVLILFTFLYTNRKDCEFGTKSMIFSLRMLSVIILITFASQITLKSNWISVFTERNVAIISFREYAGITLPYIYFLASPMLIFLVCYDCSRIQRKNFTTRSFLLASSLTSLAVSGTRSHMIIALIIIPLYFSTTGGLRRFIPTITVFTALTLIGINLAITQELASAFFSKQEASNSIKLGFIQNYIDIFSNIQTLAIGQGFNAHEWSPELRQMISLETGASKTELTYIELIRVFGLITASIFMSALAFICFQLGKLQSRHRWLLIAFILYLTNSALNPYLFSTNGILPTSLALAHIYFHLESPRTKKGTANKNIQIANTSRRHESGSSIS